MQGAVKHAFYKRVIASNARKQFVYEPLRYEGRVKFYSVKISLYCLSSLFLSCPLWQFPLAVRQLTFRVCVWFYRRCAGMGVKLVLFIYYTAPSMFTMSVLLCVCRYSLRFRQVHEHWHWHWLCQWTLPFLSVDSAPGGSQDPLQLLYLHVRIHIRHYFIFILLHFVFVTCVLL